MPILNSIIRQEAQEKNLARSLEGHGFAMPRSFYEFIEPYIRRTMQKLAVPSWQNVNIPFTDEAIVDLYRSMCAGKVRMGDEQDLARFAENVI